MTIDQHTALFHRPTLVLCLANLSHFFAMTSLFSYVGFLVVDEGWARNTDEAGFFSGMLASAVFMGRLPTAAAWGKVAGRWGRRPALLFTLCAIATGHACFGFATTRAGALLARAVLLGSCNGWVTLMGTLCAEIGEREGSGGELKVMSRVIASGSVAQLAGPAIGGALYGRFGSGARGWPALPPSAVGAALALVTLALAVAWLPETRLRDGPERPYKAVVAVGEADGDDAAGVSAARAAQPRCMPRGPLRAILCLRALAGMCTFAAFDVLPLWLISTRAVGGLAMSELSVGALLAGSALATLFFTTFVAERVVRALGLRRAFGGTMVVQAATFAVAPLLGDGSRARAACIAGAYVASSAQACTGALAFTTLQVMTNRAVTRDARAEANGAAATVEAVGKMTGPALGALAYASSVKAWGRRGHGAAFWLLAGFTTLMAVVAAFALPPAVETESDDATVARGVEGCERGAPADDEESGQELVRTGAGDDG